MYNFPVEPELIAHREFPDLQTPTGSVANLLDAELKERERNNETDGKQSDENTPNMELSPPYFLFLPSQLSAVLNTLVLNCLKYFRETNC